MALSDFESIPSRKKPSIVELLSFLALPRAILLGSLLCLSQPVLSATDAIATNILSPHTEFVSDPVFKGKVYLEQWGDNANPSIILVHGLGDNGARDWQNLAPVLAKSYHVITFDLPGFGRSGKYNELYSPDNYARFIDWLAERYAKKPFILIGHSMGGAVALTYATTYPNKLKQLILIDAAGILHPAAFSKSLMDNYKPRWWTHLIPDTAELNKLLGVGIEDFYAIPEAIDLTLSTSLTRKLMLDGDPNKIAGLAMVQKDFSGLLSQATMPTLLVWGDKDNIAPLRTGKMLNFLLPNARLVVIPESGHVPMRDTRTQLNKIILDAVANPIPARATDKHVADIGRARDEQCSKQEENYYSGNYEHLTLNDCHNVTIAKAHIKHLKITNSNVNIINSDIGGKGTALEAFQSIVFATATTIHGDDAVHLEGSRLDFAGVIITAARQAFKSAAAFKITFSLCKVTSPEFTGYRHGVYTFPGDKKTGLQ